MGHAQTFAVPVIILYDGNDVLSTILYVIYFIKCLKLFPAAGDPDQGSQEEIGGDQFVDQAESSELHVFALVIVLYRL